MVVQGDSRARFQPACGAARRRRSLPLAAVWHAPGRTARCAVRPAARRGSDVRTKSGARAAGLPTVIQLGYGVRDAACPISTG